MGGIGSGRRWHFNANATTDDYLQLDVRRWQRDGLLVEGRAFGWRWQCDDETVASIRVNAGGDKVRLEYSFRDPGDEWQHMDYWVALGWTDCHFGGARPWFLCPARGCGRRVAKLYGGRVFACRACRSLCYASQRECPTDRAMRRAETIRRRLGWPPGILNVQGGRPKGMHHATFERLVAEHNGWAEMSLALVASRFLTLEPTDLRCLAGDMKGD